MSHFKPSIGKPGDGSQLRNEFSNILMSLDENFKQRNVLILLFKTLSRNGEATEKRLLAAEKALAAQLRDNAAWSLFKKNTPLRDIAGLLGLHKAAVTNLMKRLLLEREGYAGTVTSYHNQTSRQNRGHLVNELAVVRNNLYGELPEPDKVRPSGKLWIEGGKRPASGNSVHPEIESPDYVELVVVSPDDVDPDSDLDELVAETSDDQSNA